jgi:HSP20 family protein
MSWGLLTPLGGRSSNGSGDLFSALQRELNHMFEDYPVSLPLAAASSGLRLDVKEDEKAFYVTADLPGLSEKEVEVTFDDGVLTIRGEKKIEREDKGDTWHIVERSCGSFARQLRLPTNIDAGGIEAKVDKGVLSIELPKQADEKKAAKKIDVKKA